MSARKYSALGDGPVTNEQLDGMMRWPEEIDLPSYAQVCGPRAATELREYRALDEHRRRSDEELIRRRAADLSRDEVDAIAILRSSITDTSETHGEYRGAADFHLEIVESVLERALTVLDRLLQDHEEG